MMSWRELPGWIRIPLVAGFCGWVLWRELRTPARDSTEPKLRRSARNLAVAGVASVAVMAIEMPVALSLAGWVEKERWGLVKLLRLPQWIEIPIAVLALDYSLYVWHMLTHRNKFLWRFHQPHHVDLEMDASTAIRFHFGEVGLSVAWRAAQVAVIGVSPLAFSIWQTGLILCIVFHHSNVRLDAATERRLARWLVTPRMHEIHHSNIQDEADSNWSSGLSIWDRLHGTFRLDIPREQVVIGVPAYSQPADVTLLKTLEMPFVEQRPAWRLPDGRLLLTRNQATGAEESPGGGGQGEEEFGRTDG